MPLPKGFSFRAWEALPEPVRAEVLREFGEAVRAQDSGTIKWASELSQLAERLIRNDANSSDVSLFWVRLHGVLEYIVDELKIPISLVPQNEVQRRLVEISKDIRDKASSMLQAFDREELLFVEYKRHCAAHPFLDSYFLSFKGDAPILRRHRYCVLVDEKVSLPELRAVFLRFGARYETDRAASDHFARRIQGRAHDYSVALATTHDLFR